MPKFTEIKYVTLFYPIFWKRQEFMNYFKQLINIEGLIKNRNAPVEEGLFLITHLAESCGADQNGNAHSRSIHPELLQHEHPLSMPAKLEVEDDKRREDLFNFTHMFKWKKGEVDLVPFWFKDEPEQFEDGLVVVYNENARNHKLAHFFENFLLHILSKLPRGKSY
jgi:hypothetical protein